MRRVPLLDGLRGYFLVFMLLTHLFGGAYALVRVNHAELGFVQDAQGFVFLSGLLVGALYGRRMERHGFAGPARQRAGLAFFISPKKSDRAAAAQPPAGVGIESTA